MLATGRRHAAAHPGGKNPGDVWPVTTRPYRGAHFAAFPPDIPLRCIAAGCRPGGTVGDPFAGTATTGIAARQLHRPFWGIEINPGYAALAQERLSQAPQGSARSGSYHDRRPATGTQPSLGSADNWVFSDGPAMNSQVSESSLAENREVA
jgi:site-specific DNA-methyltransferase (cytosine-N4-specific)